MMLSGNDRRMKALIAFNGSPEAHRAVDWVAQSGSFSDATVLGVGPDSARRRGRRRRGRYFSSRPGWAFPDELQQAVDQLTSAGLTATSVDESGNVVKAIVDAAAKGDFDVVVVGSRRRHGIWRTLFGSTAERIVRQAPINVVIVR